MSTLICSAKEIELFDFSTEITKDIRQNQAFANIAPNFICALKTYIVLPSSECKAEQLFSTLRRLKTCLRLTQAQQCLNDLAILNTHRDDANALDLNVSINESCAELKLAATSLE